MNNFIPPIVVLIPCLFLCWYVYRKDKVEKEPAGLISILFFAGAAVALPVILLENLLMATVDGMFSSVVSFGLTSIATFKSTGAHLAHSAVCGFFAVAFVEELAKWLVLVLITRKNKNFNYLFDGIVYAVFVSMGFAAVENVRFAVRDGWDQFIFRILDSVPGHLCFAVIMGFAYTVWHAYVMAREREKALEEKGIIKVDSPFRPTWWLIGSFALPFAVHGCYSTIKLFASETMALVFYALVIVLLGLCFVVIRRLASGDMPDDNIAHRILVREYPDAKLQAPDENGEFHGEDTVNTDGGEN